VSEAQVPEFSEISRLQERLRRLAEEKSYLQLTLRLIEKINPAPGVHNMVDEMLTNIVETIGGTDIKIWYWIEGEVFHSSFVGGRKPIAMIDDPLVAQVVTTRQFIEINDDADKSLMFGDVMPGCWTWIFPLEVAADLIGVVKLENVHIIGASLRNYLPIFFSHAALIISNEIRNHLRQRTQAALKAKTEELDTYFNSALDLFCIADTGGHFLKLNQAWTTTLGYSLDELEGRTGIEFIHSEDRAASLAFFRDVVIHNPQAALTNRFRHKSGEWRWIEWRATARGDAIYAAARDVTEKKCADDSLRLAASVFANSQEGIVITDHDNRIIDINDAFSRISGYSRDEVIGGTPSMLKSGRHDARFYADMWKSLKDRGSWHGEIWNRRKSGEVYPEILSIDAVSDADGYIRHYVGAFSDISRIKEHEAELEHIANFDALTGLPNRRLLGDRMQQELGRTQRSGRSLAVCYVDLDGFKPVNDRFGHDAGDLLLIEIARRLKESARAGDTVSRLGGDEFVLLFSDLLQEEECFHALERVLNAVSQPFAIGLDSVSVSASIGVTLYPRDNADADTLLRHADQAMYQAKESGKRRFHLFDAEHDQLIRTNRDTLQNIEQGLFNNEFVLYYQPKVDMTNGKVIGAEALIRWQHPSRGLVPPGEFLPLLTGSELEIKLGEWVIESALRQLEIWQAQGLELCVSVNISANQLLRPDFMPGIEAALKRHPTVLPHFLELEILESTAIDDMSSASRVLANCIALGLHFSLDDFGTGYSSLTYFRKLPVGTLKIDQGFVRDMLDDPEDMTIIESIIGLAKAFNRPVIAEGVETIEHGAMLVMLGCDQGQGYGISRPMPAAQLPAWMEQWSGEEIWQTLGKYKVPSSDLVLVVAEHAYQKWIDQAEAHIRQPESKPQPATQHQQCSFGRWYYGSGISRYGQYKEFTELEVIHHASHQLLHELIRLNQAGSQEPLDGPLAELAIFREKMKSGLQSLVKRISAKL